MKAEKTTLIHISVLSIMMLFLYSLCLKNEFVWDDLSLIAHNDKIHHFSQIPKLFFLDFFDSQRIDGPDTGGYYRPLILASFAFDRFFWGKAAFGFHLTNILLHLANALLTYGLIRKLLRNFWAAFFASLFFAIHPLQVDAVAYISGRTDLLATTFLLICLLSVDRGEESGRGRFFYGLVSALALAGSLFSKEIGLIGAPLLFVYFYGLKRRPFWRSCLRLLPYAAVSAGYLVLRQHVLKIPSTEWIENITGIGWRFLSILIPWAESFRLLFWPDKIYFERFQPVLDRLTLPSATGLLLFFGFLALLFYFWKKNRTLFFFGSLYLLALLPVLQLHPMYVQDSLFWTEHFLYLPTVGLFPIIAVGLGRLAASSRRRSASLASLAALFLIPLCFFTGSRIGDWQNEERLFLKAIQHNPKSARAHNNLALRYQNKGETDKAVSHYEQAIELNPLSPGSYNNLGNIYKEQGCGAKAIDYYEKAIRLGSNTAGVFHNLADLYRGKKDLAMAEQVCLVGIMRVKNPYLLYNQLGMLYLEEGRKQSAMLVFQKALEIKPDFVLALNNSGILMAQSRKYQKAEELFQKALYWNPDLPQTHNNLGNLYLLMKRYGEAKKSYEKALQLDPGYEDPAQGLEHLAQMKN